VETYSPTFRRLASPDQRFAEWAKAVGVKHGKLAQDDKDDMIHELDATSRTFMA